MLMLMALEAKAGRIAIELAAARREQSRPSAAGGGSCSLELNMRSPQLDGNERRVG